MSLSICFHLINQISVLCVSFLGACILRCLIDNTCIVFLVRSISRGSIFLSSFCSSGLICHIGSIVSICCTCNSVYAHWYPSLEYIFMFPVICRDKSPLLLTISYHTYGKIRSKIKKIYIFS